jgi:hypothetical protein
MMKTTIQPQYQAWLMHLQANYNPKAIHFIDRLTTLRIQRPAGIQKDQINLFFQKKNDLLKRGHIVWGQVVQANQLLFYPGMDNAPADVLFCPNPHSQNNPEALASIADRLYEIKGSQPDDPELAKLAAAITDESGRHFGLSIPQSLSPDFPTETSVIYIVRKHLPNGYLTQKVLPLLIYPEQPRIVMVLPCRYWPVEMEDWWIS